MCIGTALWRRAQLLLHRLVRRYAHPRNVFRAQRALRNLVQFRTAPLVWTADNEILRQ
jgi:hypothetical protein